MMEFERKHTCHLTVLRQAIGDSTNGGPSSKMGRITVAVFRNQQGRLPNYHEAKSICRELCESKQSYVFIACQYSEDAPVVCTPVTLNARYHTMAGGNYASTCNAIEQKALGWQHPISIHDRVE